MKLRQTQRKKLLELVDVNAETAAPHFFVLVLVPFELTAVLSGIGIVEPSRVHGHAHTEI